MAAHPEFETCTVESNRIEAELAPQREKKTREKFEHIESVARRLMERNPRLTFGAALEMTRNCLPAVQAEMADALRQSVKAVEPMPRTLLIRGSEGTYVD
jgi:hypothetical protein